MKYSIGLIFVLSFLLLSACNVPADHKIAFVGETQGTYYRLTYFADDTVVSQRELEVLLQEFDNSVSVYNPTSLVSRVNNGDTTVKVDDYFIQTWNVSQDVSVKTNGAFDITVGPLVEAWGFSFREKTPLASIHIDSLRSLVDYSKITLLDGKIHKENSNMHIDFNAVAQGVSVDVVSDLLTSKGVKSYLVDIGGEVLAKGYKPGRQPWRVGIEKPNDNAAYGEEMQAIVALSNKSLATSGSYRKFYMENGVRYSHTINPKTGYPVTHTLLSVTVITDVCGYADAWATAMMVLGPEEAQKLTISLPDVEALLIYTGEDGNITTWASKGFSDVMEQ